LDGPNHLTRLCNGEAKHTGTSKGDTRQRTTRERFKIDGVLRYSNGDDGGRLSGKGTIKHVINGLGPDLG
jgi:hypothetical protein